MKLLHTLLTKLFQWLKISTEKLIKLYHILQPKFFQWLKFSKERTIRLYHILQPKLFQWLKILTEKLIRLYHILKPEFFQLLNVLKTKLIRLGYILRFQIKNLYLSLISISKKMPYTVRIGLIGILALILAFNLLDGGNKTLSELQQLAKQTAERHNVDASLIFAIIKQESGWKPNVVSKAGAIGLMQIMPGTGAWACGLTRKELFDPHKNLDCGVRYFRQQLRNFGDVKLALCAYNAGPGNVKDGRCPPFKETTQYARNILKMWNK